jgi:CRISPR-associated protein Csm4
MFKFSKTEFSLNTPQNTNCITLSLYIPHEEEIPNLKDGFYELTVRKGYIFSPEVKSLRKKSVITFSEGSVFPGSITGSIVDVSPGEHPVPHKVYKYGYALTLPYGGLL